MLKQKNELISKNNKFIELKKYLIFLNSSSFRITLIFTFLIKKFWFKIWYKIKRI